ncbi:YARHG domain-containing protein [Flavobacterium procerum]|uniref:YARHG domain-containing protein n=1 Tax=Flavobacterium procerum TaxID=1455569 RepID=A0ABV6BWU7_9FLAO
MKKLVYLLAAALLFSCNSKEKNTAEDKKETAQPEELRTDLYGSWVGDFIIAERDATKSEKERYRNTINIIIKKITSKEVIGQSIVAGNNRPLTGVMTKRGNTYHFTLKEPGDDKNDGVFNFDVVNDTIISGMWKAYNTKKEVTKRKFELVKKEFKYDPNVMLPNEDLYVDYENPKEEEISHVEGEENEEENYGSTLYRMASQDIFKINSSTQKLEESDIKNLKKLDLEILRNTIYARHGLSFKTRTVRQFFDGVEWYIPISTNVEDKLTKIEQQNIVLLKRFEKYAEDNYDTFGR